MKKSTHSSNRLSVSKRMSIAMTLLLIAIFCVPALTAQVAPSGSIIGNQATATYVDANSVTRTAFSNLVQTTVTQLYKGSITADNSKYATPGTQVIFPHVYTNTGNGPDTVSLAATNVNASLTNYHIYLDANGDGIPDNTTDITGVAQAIASGATLKFVVVATLAPGAGSGAYTLRATATSGGGGAGVVTGTTSNYDTDTVTESNNGVINVTKSMTAAAVGGTSTVTLTYTNTGNNTATSVAIIDDLPAQGGNFTYATNSGSWNGASFTDASAPTGLTWTLSGTGNNVITATIASVAPGVTGTIKYNVTVGTPGTYPAVFNNYAKYNYNDGSAVVPGASSYINTNTVTLSFNGIAAVKFTAGTATYTAGTPTAGTPPPNTTPDTNIIASTSYSQGATITWSQTLTNKGQLLDTYNLNLDTTGASGLNAAIPAANQFPAGTIFQLYRADGKTPLTDSNGDGIVDAGPLSAGAGGSVSIVVAATLPAGATVSSSTTYIVNLVATSTNSTASNFSLPGLQDVIQDEVIIASTKNAAVDLVASATDASGQPGYGAGKSGEGYTPAIAGNPGATLAIPFWLFNNGTNAAPDAYNLSFRYMGTSAVGDLTTPLTPFTSAQAGTVPGAIGTTIPAWTVLIAPNTGTACSAYGAPITATNVIAASGNQEYCLLLQVPPSYSAATYRFVVQAQSNSTGAIDQMAVQATVNTLHSVSISPNNQGTVYAGGTVVYKHVVTNGGNQTETTASLGIPSFQTAPAGWTVAVYSDTNTNGQLDSADASLVTPSTITSLAPGASLTYFVVIQAPSSANPGDQQVASWVLSLTGNGSSSTSVTDTTTVVSGQVKLVKSVVLDSSCSILQANWPAQTFSTTGGSATSQQCLIYQIQATNTGTAAVNTLVVADSAPPYTTINGTVLEKVPAAGCGTLATGTVATSGTSFTAPFTGNVPAGCVVNVYFEVKLN